MIYLTDSCFRKISLIYCSLALFLVYTPFNPFIASECYWVAIPEKLYDSITHLNNKAILIFYPFFGMHLWIIWNQYMIHSIVFEFLFTHFQYFILFLKRLWNFTDIVLGMIIIEIFIVFFWYLAVWYW